MPRAYGDMSRLPACLHGDDVPIVKVEDHSVTMLQGVAWAEQWTAKKDLKDCSQLRRTEARQQEWIPAAGSTVECEATKLVAEATPPAQLEASGLAVFTKGLSFEELNPSSRASPSDRLTMRPCRSQHGRRAEGCRQARRPAVTEQSLEQGLVVRVPVLPLQDTRRRT